MKRLVRMHNEKMFEYPYVIEETMGNGRGKWVMLGSFKTRQEAEIELQKIIAFEEGLSESIVLWEQEG